LLHWKLLGDIFGFFKGLAENNQENSTFNYYGGKRKLAATKRHKH
jgi:hypothetical protein